MTDRACPGYGCDRQLAPGRTLCPRCIHRAERIIGDLVAETLELETTITRQSKTTARGHRKKGDELPLPVNLRAADRGDDALALLFEWADFVAQAHKEPGMPIRTTGVDKRVELVTQAVGILLRHIDWLGTNDQGPDCASAVWHVRANLRRVTDRPLERLFAGPCKALLPAGVTEVDGRIVVSLTKSRCTLDLYRPWGSDTITCDGHNDPGQAHLPTAQRQGCGTVHLAAERDEFLRDAVAEHLLPLRLVWESLYVLLPGTSIEWDTAYRWTKPRKVEADGKQVTLKPRLTPRAVANDGTKLYRGGDIIVLARATSERGRARRRRRRGKLSA